MPSIRYITVLKAISLMIFGNAELKAAENDYKFGFVVH